MTIGKICNIVGEASQLMLQTGFLDADGNLVKNPSVEVITQTAARVEQILKDAGVNVPSSVELLVRLVPLVLPIFEHPAAKP